METYNKKNLTLSVGTSALNEENMIANFLESLLMQEQISFRLERIIINSDGSTDRTTSIARSFNNKKIYVIEHTSRKGKKARIAQLLQANTSDVLLILDTDMLLGSSRSLEALIRAFYNPLVGIAALNVQPIRSKTFTGKIIYRWEKIWLEIRTVIHHGNTIFSLRGGAFAVRGKLVKELSLTSSIHQIAEYLYFVIREKGFSFRFVENALVYYRQPETFTDYLSILSRGDNEDVARFQEMFGHEIAKEYNIPRKEKYKVFWKTFLKSPISLVVTLVFIKITRMISKNRNNLDRHGFWPVVNSTKKTFTLKDI
jgi:glycosyltransferase involved in cell wall biosynthesis